MPQEPFPDPGPGGEEPEDSSLLPGEGDGLDYELPPEGAEQGLFVTLPAEEMSLAGFAEDGRTDTMAPGPLLAAILSTVAGEGGQGLSGLSDDQLIGFLSGARRMESLVAWTQMAALREFARRHPGRGGAGVSEFAAEEVADELRLTGPAAAGQIDYACAVADRLPGTFAALAAGLIHPVHVRIVEDETRILSDADAARADEQLAEAARSKTFGELRYAAHRLVLKLDPEAARKRKERARQDAHVRRFREDSGNAGMVARELPPDEVLASWQHVEQRALDLRAAGVPGTLQELRVRAYLDLLQERDCRDLPDLAGTGGADRTSASDGAGGNGGPPDGTDGPGGPGSGGNGGKGGPGPRGGGPAGTGPVRGGPDGRARPGADKGPSIAALVNITVPLTAMSGDTGPPGEAAGFGLLDHQGTRDLAAAAARHPNTRWCVTVLNPDGTATAHGCAVGRYQLLTGTSPQDLLSRLGITLTPLARGPCGHERAETGYTPSRALEHLINTRNTRCTAPGCGRPAARCDKDHTLAWDKGGLTCECNLAPLCRHHHRCKQAEGWRLEQPEPGVLLWRTPAGRTYTTTPSHYPV
jgi:hypothetical protein